MDKYITNLYGHSLKSTAMEAQHMITSIAQKQGYREIGVRAHNVSLDTEEEKNKRVEGLLASVSSEALIIAQMPTWNGIAFDKVFLSALRQRAEKLVIFVHDFVPLMFVNNAYLAPQYIEAYNLADLIILPSKKMVERLRGQGLTAAVKIQQIWDHTTPLEFLNAPYFEKRIKFIGNIGRFPFVKEWEEEVPLEVFSDGELLTTEHLISKGWKNDDELLIDLHHGGFGLVWSEDIENQYERQYSEMNVSFKLSTYLAAGLPIIVNKGISKQSFVEKYKIGYVVANLNEAVKVVKESTAVSYQCTQHNVKQFSELLREGFFTQKMLNEIQAFLYLGEEQNDHL